MLNHGRRLVNPDGSRNVYCVQCSNFIGAVQSTITFNSAICTLCQLANEGVEITDEMARELRSVRVGNAAYSEAAINPEKGKDPIAELYESVPSSQVRFSFKALVKNMRETVKEIIAKKEQPESKKIAVSKKRKRVFEDLSLEKEGE